MINIFEVTETNKMVEKENLDVRTITMGINLLDCASENLDEVNEKIYKKITTLAKDLVSTGESIAKEFGVPIVNKRISISPFLKLVKIYHICNNLTSCAYVSLMLPLLSTTISQPFLNSSSPSWLFMIPSIFSSE